LKCNQIHDLDINCKNSEKHFTLEIKDSQRLKPRGFALNNGGLVPKSEDIRGNSYLNRRNDTNKTKRNIASTLVKI